MKTILPLVLSAAVSLAMSEFGELCPWLAEALVRWSARRLGDDQARERYEEEYLANLDKVPGKVSKLLFSFGCAVNVPRMRWTLRAGRQAQAEPAEQSAQDNPANFIGLY